MARGRGRVPRSHCTSIVGSRASARGAVSPTLVRADSYHRLPVGNTPFDLGTQVCGFPIHVGIVSDNDYYTHQTTLADGTLIQQINGNLVMTHVKGLNSSFFGPIGQANTGEPGFVLSSGLLVIHYSATTGAAESFKLSGTQTNGCQLLS
jgi:hypothetical protein